MRRPDVLTMFSCDGVSVLCLRVSLTTTGIGLIAADSATLVQLGIAHDDVLVMMYW